MHASQHHQHHTPSTPRRTTFRRKLIHAILTGLRIIVVIIAIHFGIRYLELHNILSRFGKTGEFICGSVVDYLLFGMGEGGN